MYDAMDNVIQSSIEGVRHSGTAAIILSPRGHLGGVSEIQTSLGVSDLFKGH